MGNKEQTFCTLPSVLMSDASWLLMPLDTKYGMVCSHTLGSSELRASEAQPGALLQQVANDAASSADSRKMEQRIAEVESDLLKVSAVLITFPLSISDCYKCIWRQLHA